MIEQGIKYEVKDAIGRSWGTIKFEYPFSHEEPLLGATISGHLNTSTEFSEVWPIFERHHQLMEMENAPESDMESSHQNIAGLGVVLVNLENGQREEVSPVIVSEGYLLTCPYE